MELTLNVLGELGNHFGSYAMMPDWNKSRYRRGEWVYRELCYAYCAIEQVGNLISVQSGTILLGSAMLGFWRRRTP